MLLTTDLRGGLASLVLGAGLLTSAATAGAAGVERVYYYEPFRITPTAYGPVARKSSTGAVRAVHFNAFGRRFDLALERNTRLDLGPFGYDAAGPALSLYRGVIEGLPGSWVRLSARAEAIRGMLWDGRELYIVELADAVNDAYGAPVQAPLGTMVIFKLGDATLPEEVSCGDPLEQPKRSATQAYRSLLKELSRSPVLLQAVGASVRLELSVLGDSFFRQRYPGEQQSRDEILLRLNNVDGIFSAQLGIELQVPVLEIEAEGAGVFTATTTPSTLLRELSQLRGRTPQFNSRGLTHLFTGRDLDGNVVGIAYDSTLCWTEYGVGLTEASSRSSWLESLIAAHEIGHNFGAPHDGEDECAATPTGQFVMSPAVKSTISSFSDCSVQVMRTRAQSASCITPLSPADLAIPADMGTIKQTVSSQFNWDLTVSNTGGSTAIDAQAEVTLPTAVQIADAWVDSGTCTHDSGVVACRMGDIPGSSSRIVHLSLHSDVVGSNSIAARVSAQNDGDAANDTGGATLVIEEQSQVATTPQPLSGSGGGGALGLGWLSGLAGLYWARRRCKRPD